MTPIAKVAMLNFDAILESKTREWVCNVKAVACSSCACYRLADLPVGLLHACLKDGASWT
jgi:hypothetical protein